MTEKLKIFHCLHALQFDRGYLESVSQLADGIRGIARSKEGMAFLTSVLFDKRAMLYFAQPSTRTFLSFYSACQVLGLKCAEVRDTRTSSEIKGESEEDTVHTFSMFFDLIIMRHPRANFAGEVAAMLDGTERPVPVINAGSGKDQHPTQALVDIYTLMRSFRHRGGIDGKKVALVGDLLRGRTVRSLSCLLNCFEGVRLYFVAPSPYQIGEDILTMLEEGNTKYEMVEDFASVIPEVDAIYMTRLQNEWDLIDGTAQQINMDDYSFTVDHLNHLKPEAVLLHPLPRRQEIATMVDRDPRAAYWRQVRNGMWIRAALIAGIFQRDQEIRDYFYRSKVGYTHNPILT